MTYLRVLELFLSVFNNVDVRTKLQISGITFISTTTRFHLQIFSLISVQCTFLPPKSVPLLIYDCSTHHFRFNYLHSYQLPLQGTHHWQMQQNLSGLRLLVWKTCNSTGHNCISNQHQHFSSTHLLQRLRTRESQPNPLPEPLPTFLFLFCQLRSLCARENTHSDTPFVYCIWCRRHNIYSRLETGGCVRLQRGK